MTTAPSEALKLYGTEQEVPPARTLSAGALTAWLHCVAAEAAQDNVTLNVLKPPPFWRSLPDTGRVRSGSAPAPGGVAAPLARTGPEDRHLPPASEVLSAEEVAAVAAFHLSDRARGVYGRTLEMGAAMAVRRRPNEAGA